MGSRLCSLMTPAFICRFTPLEWVCQGDRAEGAMCTWPPLGLCWAMGVRLQALHQTQ